jgi:hypothetical protein
MFEKRRASALGRGGVVILTGALCVLASGRAQAADEVQVYGIANFGGAGQCGTSDMTHSVHTATAAAFRAPFDLFKLASLWDETATINNSSAKGSLFQDASKKATGADTALDTGADEADVIYLHTHGNHTGPSIDTSVFPPKLVGPAFSKLSMGNSSFTCGARTDTDMLWGQSGGDLDIAVIKACQSGDHEVWSFGGYNSMQSSSGSLSMWNAFHGDSSCGGNVTDYVGDYAATSMSNGVGENWIDDAYDGAFWPWEDDDCPVSIVWGSSKSVRKNMFENGGFRDRKDTGSKSGSTYFFVAGCDPDHGSKLPE